MEKIMKFALFGQGVEKSLSPAIYKNFAQQFDIKLDYQKIIVTPESFIPAWNNFVKEGGCGANITIPCKRQAYALCTTLSPTATLAGSVNTIKINTPTQWYGENTD